MLHSRLGRHAPSRYGDAWHRYTMPRVASGHRESRPACSPPPPAAHRRCILLALWETGRWVPPATLRGGTAPPPADVRPSARCRAEIRAGSSRPLDAARTVIRKVSQFNERQVGTERRSHGRQDRRPHRQRQHPACSNAHWSRLLETRRTPATLETRSTMVRDASWTSSQKVVFMSSAGLRPLLVVLMLHWQAAQETSTRCETCRRSTLTLGADSVEIFAVQFNFAHRILPTHTAIPRPRDNRRTTMAG